MTLARGGAPAAGRALVAVSRLSKSYRQGDQQFQALREVSFDLEPASLVVVLGPSGCGKSTLLHMIGGMDRPSSGEVAVLGNDIARWSSDRLALYRRSDVGFVFQAYNLLASQSSLRNVATPLLVAGRPKAERERRARELLDRVGLGDKADSRVSHLSGGQAQRVAVARALAADPPILLADEPTGNLDSTSGSEIMALLASLARDDGRCVVVVTHNEEFAALADRVIRMKDGVIHEDRAVANPRSVAPAAPGGPSEDGHIGLVELARIAWQDVTSRVARAVLTAGGIAIGVALTVLLVGVGVGIKTSVLASVSSFGPLTMVSVSPANPRGAFSGQAPPRTVSTSISAATLAKLAGLPQVKAAYPAPTFVATARSGTRVAEVALSGLPPVALWSTPGILPAVVAGHLRGGGAGVALPRVVAESLASPRGAAASSVVGRTILVTTKAETGTVLGGTGALTSPPATQPGRPMVVEAVVRGPVGFVGHATAMTWMDGFRSPGQQLRYPGAEIVAKSAGDVTPIVDQVKRMGLTPVSLEQTARSIDKAFGVVEAAMGAVGAVALVVAGLMIGVVMSMSVLERKREIGILRAVGARRRDVSLLFLMQAGLVGSAGGIVGVLLALGSGTAINAVVGSLAHNQGAVFRLTWWLVVGGVALGTAAATLAGAVPSRRAASLSPVDALRQE